jgi:hypothetical protein
MSICLEPGVVPSNSKGRCQSSPRPRACEHATIRVPNASRGRGARQSKYRYTNVESPHIQTDLGVRDFPFPQPKPRPRVILNIPWGDWSPSERNAEPAVGKVSVPSIGTINQRKIPKARRRSPDSERHSVNDPHQRSVGQWNLTLPYLHYTPSEHYRSRVSQQCPAKTRRRRIRISLSGS